MKRQISLLMAMLLVLQLVLPNALAASDFVPNPQTAYATLFVEKCNNQQWFLNEVERLLNIEQKSINTLTSASDLNNIKAIGLSGKGIIGTIPEAIGELQGLRDLFLANNKLSGTIPTQLYTLPRLRSVDLGGNQYTGAIPTGFGSVATLESLILKENTFSGTIPAEILAHTGIQVLDLSENKLTGTIPSSIGQMTALTYLNLSQNAWGGGIPDLSAQQDLITLALWGCGLTGEIAPSIYTLTKLQVLDLASNTLTGTISEDIANLTDMQFLSLEANQLTGAVPNGIAAMTKLEKLNLSSNKLQGVLPDIFLSLQLDEVDLENNFLRGLVPASLKLRYDNGTKVYLMNNYMTGTDLKNMTNNGENFVDDATGQQYQLTSSLTTVQLSELNTVNVYLYLQNRSLTTGNTTQKVRLNPNEYVVTVVSGNSADIQITVDGAGIYIMALTAIPATTNYKIEIAILNNNGSDYSKTTVTLTTDATSGGGGGGGGGTTGTQVSHTPYISGYPDGTFQSTNQVSREEAVTMIIRALDIQPSTLKVATFQDVSADRWSFGYVEEAARRGFVKGYGDGVFMPQGAMTRAELATVLVQIARSQGRETNLPNPQFHDVEDGQWYASYVIEAAQMGLISGYEDGTFRPGSPVSRVEAVCMINGLLNRDSTTAAELGSIACPFSDLSSSYWGYLQIMEAAVTHQH